jgi:hypothetical protein
MVQVAGLTSNQTDLMKRVVEAYSEGAGDVEIARLLGITRRRFDELCAENESFAELVERGRTLAEAWWYEMARKGLFMEKFNSTLLAFNMKNRYGWADKVEMGEKNSEGPLNQDQLRSELQSALRKIGKKHPELLRQLEENKDD